MPLVVITWVVYLARGKRGEMGGRCRLRCEYRALILGSITYTKLVTYKAYPAPGAGMDFETPTGQAVRTVKPATQVQTTERYAGANSLGVVARWHYLQKVDIDAPHRKLIFRQNRRNYWNHVAA